MKKLLIINCLFLVSLNAHVRPNTKTRVSPARVAVLYALQEKAWNDFKMSMIAIKKMEELFKIIKEKFVSRKKAAKTAA